MRYTALIFDFFDVIHVDPLLAWLRRHKLKREGAPHVASVELDHGRIDMSMFFERLGRVTGQAPNEVREEFDSVSGVDPEVVGFIRQLHQRYKTALLSNADSTHIRGILGKHNRNNLFDKIVVSSEVGAIKPHQDVFRHVLHELGVEPSEAIFVDDNPVNVAAAQALGIAGLRYKDLPTLRHDLEELGVAPITGRQTLNAIR